MSLQALTGAQAPQLCSTLLEEPQDIANSHYCKGILYRTAAVIAGLALIVIFTGSMALYFGFLSISTVPLWIWIVAPVSAIACVPGGMVFLNWSTQEFAKVSKYQAFSDKYNELRREWGLIHVIDFCVEQQLIQGIDSLPFDRNVEEALRQKSPHEPYLALLPLIARYKVLSEKAEELPFWENLLQGAHYYEDPKEELESRDDQSFARLRQAIILQNILYPTKEYELEGRDQWFILKARGEAQILGHLKRKEPPLRIDADIEQLFHNAMQRFSFNEGEGPESVEIREEWLYGQQPSSIRRLIFDH